MSHVLKVWISIDGWALGSAWIMRPLEIYSGFVDTLGEVMETGRKSAPGAHSQGGCLVSERFYLFCATER